MRQSELQVCEYRWKGAQEKSRVEDTLREALPREVSSKFSYQIQGFTTELRFRQHCSLKTAKEECLSVESLSSTIDTQEMSLAFLVFPSLG